MSATHCQLWNVACEASRNYFLARVPQASLADCRPENLAQPKKTKTTPIYTARGALFHYYATHPAFLCDDTTLAGVFGFQTTNALKLCRLSAGSCIDIRRASSVTVIFDALMAVDIGDLNADAWKAKYGKRKAVGRPDYRGFSQHLVKNYFPECFDIDAADFQEIAETFNIIRREGYNPAKHGSAAAHDYDVAPGDDYFVPNFKTTPPKGDKV